MALPRIVYRSLRQHALSTLITAGSIALASGLLMSVWMVEAQSRQAFLATSTGFDAVLGARGSKLQLVLNAIFDLEASPGNVSWADYQYVKHLPVVRTAIPIAVGDNLRGYRIVGTVPELFTGVQLAPGRRFALEPGGRLFDPAAKEAVIGNFAARKLGLKVGDTFHPFHGLAYSAAGGNDEHPDLFTVTGILEPTNSPADRVVWVPLHALQTMTGHDPKYATDVSAVLLQFSSPLAGFRLDTLYNKQGDRLTLAYPVSAIIADLFSRIAWFDRVLTLVAYLVALVAAGSVLASIYNSMSARQRDLAILRALGARRRTVFGAVVAEAAAIGAVGALVGFACYFALLAVVAGIVREQTGVVLDVLAWQPILWIWPLVMVALCALGGIVPALKAYRTPVAATLAPTS
jgi:putative ABC transport system permease protein